MSTVQIDENQIAEAAFYIWLEEGKPHGKDAQHWEQARAQLHDAISPAKPRCTRAKAGTTAKATTTRKTAAAKKTTTRAKAPAKAAASTAKTAEKTTKTPAKRATRKTAAASKAD